MKLNKHEVPVKKLRWECDPGMFTFKCTRDLPPLREFIGQERATRAVELGLNITSDGYNIYVAGLTGTGKTSMVKAYIERVIREKEVQGKSQVLEDWCYLYNFKDSDKPQIASLPQGKGKVFRNEITALLNKIRQGLGRTFSGEEYKKQRQQTIESGQVEQQKLFEKISSEARRQGFILQGTSSRLALIPVKDDHPMQEQEYLTLDESARKELDVKRKKLLKKLQISFDAASSLQTRVQEELQKADKDIAETIVSGLFTPLFERYSSLQKITQYLADLKAHTLDNLDLFKGNGEQTNAVLGMQVNQAMGEKYSFIQFQVNIFVDNSKARRTPVIVEDNPTIGNILGKVDSRLLMGAYISDHTMIKAGALSQANGGYLLLSAKDVLLNSGVWSALKRAIKNKEVRIEDSFEQLGLVSPQGLKPEPMPIDVKVILTGDAELYQLLSAYDEDFWEIFKIKADFDSEIDRNRSNIMAYAAFLSGSCEECKVRHFDPSGVARVIEYSARIVADQERLSTRFAQIKDWITEANYWASLDNARYISASHVEKAIEEKLFRHNLLEERIGDMIDRGTIMIDFKGTAVGQVNALSVNSLGDISFGKPSRITAKTFLGRSGVINIERESELSGPIHNKGVMILSGYLGNKYAQDKPLSLSASLCFEQSYQGVEGDSASSTELYAILSSLSGVPVKQNIAVTGSVNQNGEIQPIGGVNQKIEGFFKTCKAKGLTGDQGVLIPALNIKNLMLHKEVIEAVRKGQFHIYSAKNINEGIEILTGIPSGRRRKNGTYTKGTVNYLVDKKLREMAERLKGYYTGSPQPI